MWNDLLTMRAPCVRGEERVTHVREAAEPGALPGTSREAFPGVSLHPTDFGVHLIPTPCAPHCQGSRINPTTQTLHCASAVGKRALQEACASARSIPAQDLPPHTLPSHTHPRGWGSGRQTLWSFPASSFHTGLPSGSIRAWSRVQWELWA